MYIKRAPSNINLINVNKFKKRFNIKITHIKIEYKNNPTISI